MTASHTAGFDPLDDLCDELAALERDGLRRRVRTVCPLPDGRCEVNGRVLINFSTNDYLGLAGHPRVVEAARQALSNSGAGARASAVVTGRTQWHQQLEERIADFEGTEAALLFPTGYAANMGVIAALVGPGDVVCGDRLNHASLIDGCRLSGATFRVYPHQDVDRLDRELQKHMGARRRLIATDGLFSMDGDIAPLAELCDVAERRQAMLLVDEAHGTGVLGDHGRGAGELLGVEQLVPVRMGTLSKAIGSQGGFVAGSQTLIDWLLNRARSQMFSTALCPAACAAARAAFDVIETEPQRRQQLSANVACLRQTLRDVGVHADGDPRSPIVPVIIGDAATTIAIAAYLEGRGLLVPAIRPPSVPRGKSRLRITVTADHTQADLMGLAERIRDATRQFTDPENLIAINGVR